jgi:hypothetical protein
MGYNENCLAHHGILGQKWGKRNGPPYPLKAGEHTPKEKTGQGKNAAEKVMAKYANKDLAGIDPATASVLAYLTAEIALVAAVKIASDVKYKKEIKSNSSDTSDIQKKIQGEHSAEDDLKAVNPDFSDPTDMGARVNCTMCSTAYELRRRGYDVVAQKSTVGRKPEDVTSWFGLDKKDLSKFKTRDEFAKALEAEPDGARGLTFTAYGQFGSHHCMIWEKNNGKVTISDGQCNAAPKSIKESGISATSGMLKYQYIRTDNATINWDAIRDAVKERTE